MIVITWQAFID